MRELAIEILDAINNISTAILLGAAPAAVLWGIVYGFSHDVSIDAAGAEAVELGLFLFVGGIPSILINFGGFIVELCRARD